MDSAQKILIRRHIDSELVQDRLQRYKNIGELFSLRELQNCTEKPPYYCHFMEWRLGTWKDESWFIFFESIIQICRQIKGWENKYRVPKGCEFDNFWSFLWELQAAAFLSNFPELSLEWTRSGPDIQANIDQKTVFIECTTYHKSFALEEFISELFNLINPVIKVSHVPFLKFSLPKNKEIDPFLNKLFSPFLENTYLLGKLDEVEHRSPVILYQPKDIERFFVYLSNQNAPEIDYDLNQLLYSTGEPISFQKNAINEVLKNKIITNANNLTNLHPNILMSNMVLGLDWQLSEILRGVPDFKINEGLDAIFLSVCGINQLPDSNNSTVFYNEDTHPFRHIFSKVV